MAEGKESQPQANAAKSKPLLEPTIKQVILHHPLNWSKLTALPLRSVMRPNFQPLQDCGPMQNLAIMLQLAQSNRKSATSRRRLELLELLNRLWHSITAQFLLRQGLKLLTQLSIGQIFLSSSQHKRENGLCLATILVEQVFPHSDLEAQTSTLP